MKTILLHSHCKLFHQVEKTNSFGVELEVIAKAIEIDGDKCKVEMTLTAEGKICALGEGLFVAVKEGHPAYHRWH